MTDVGDGPSKPVHLQAGYGTSDYSWADTLANWGPDEDSDYDLQDVDTDFVQQSTHQQRRNKNKNTTSTAKLNTKNSDTNTESDKVVVHMTVHNKTVKQVHQMKLIQRLSEICITPQNELKYTITGALRIVCTRLQADNLLNIVSLPFCDDNVKFTENKSNPRMEQGLIRGIPTFYSEEELKEIFSNYKVINVRRFTKPIKNIQEPTETILLTFASGLPCPERIFLGFQSLRVVKFINSAPRCSNCKNYGHLKAICSRSPKCAKCGDKHITSVCTEELVIDKCVNCGGPHRTGYKDCKYSKQAADITRTTVHCGLSYAAAARLHHNTKHVHPPSSTSNNAATQSLQSNNTLSKKLLSHVSQSTALQKSFQLAPQLPLDKSSSINKAS